MSRARSIAADRIDLSATAPGQRIYEKPGLPVTWFAINGGKVDTAEAVLAGLAVLMLFLPRALSRPETHLKLTLRRFKTVSNAVSVARARAFRGD